MDAVVGVILAENKIHVHDLVVDLVEGHVRSRQQNAHRVVHGRVPGPAGIVGIPAAGQNGEDADLRLGAAFLNGVNDGADAQGRVAGRLFLFSAEHGVVVADHHQCHLGRVAFKFAVF